MSDMKYFDNSFVIRQNSESKDGKKVYYDGDISTGRLDSYYTRMSDQALKSYAKEAKNGVPVLALHDQTLQIGRSVSGNYNDSNKSVRSNFYLQKELPLNGPGYATSDAYIDSVNEGTLRGLSIGAKVEKETCDFCSSEIKRYNFLGMTFAECSSGHYPGQKIYIDRKGKESKEPKKGLKEVTITSTIEKADLKEFSVVPFAATPGAKVIRGHAREALTAGKLEEKHLHQLSLNYKISRSDIENIPQPIPKGDIDMDDKKDLSQTETVELQEENDRLKADLENSKELRAAYQQRYEDECVKTAENDEKIQQLEQIEDLYHKQEDTIKELRTEIADLQKRMVNVRHTESKAERYDKLCEKAREEVVFQYTRANSTKCTPEMEELQRKRVEKIDDYDELVTRAALYRDDARRLVLGKGREEIRSAPTEPEIDEHKFQ